jgi:hypothetical protein
MIKITRNDGATFLTVSRSAFEGIFRRQGYVLFETADGRPQTAEDASEKSDDDLFRESVEAKPISQWSVEELRRYAVLVGLETADGRRQTAAELRSAIKAVIDGKAADGGEQNDSEE